jgi:hypothetical protein
VERGRIRRTEWIIRREPRRNQKVERREEEEDEKWRSKEEFPFLSEDGEQWKKERLDNRALSFKQNEGIFEWYQLFLFIVRML